MYLSNLFEKIADKHHERRRQRMAGYREFVAGIATGEEPDADEVERMLTAAGKSLDDLRQDVELYQRRMALKAIVASVPKLETERSEIDKQIAAADRVLEAAEKKHEETTQPLYGIRQQVQQALSDASRAQMDLVNMCNDDDLQKEMAELDTESARLYQEYRQKVDRASFMEERAKTERQHAEREIGQADIDGRCELADRYQTDAEVAGREVKRLEKERANLDKRREQLEQQMRQT